VIRITEAQRVRVYKDQEPGVDAMIFESREAAGRELAKKLGAFANRADVTVLGIPRGGVVVAYEIATALRVSLDIFLSRKLGVPGHEEFAFGAVAAEDGRYLDQQIIRAAKISPLQIERITAEVKATLNQRAAAYRGNKPPLEVAGRTIILVDDGIATGASVFAAIRALRQMKPALLVLAVPVVPSSTYSWLQSMVDQIVILSAPEKFYAVGQFYEDFSQVEDGEVIALLRRAERLSSTQISESGSPEVNREVCIDLGTMQLAGDLSVPANALGLVLFAHGSGSSRSSPRNQYVAKVLQSNGMATLLFDLLTRDEELIDQRTSEFRFDIGLLAQRLEGTTRWVHVYAATQNLPIGYFGASTGAAAALVAAAQLPELVTSVVSRGGRPDLADDSLRRVRASVLLLVGGKDELVIALNQKALQRLHCESKQLVVVPGATHLFEEPGALEKVAAAAADWFVRYLAPRKTIETALAPAH
jgi:putative phosphoribosyl transferase